MFGTLGLTFRALRCPDSPCKSIAQTFAPQISPQTGYLRSTPLAAVVRLSRLAIQGAGIALVVTTALSCDRVNTTGVADDSHVAAVKVYPEAVALPAGGKQQVSASAVDEDGDPVLGVQYNWTSSNSTVATVSAGVIKAVSAGTAYIQAMSGSHMDSVAVTVLAPQSNSPPVLTTIELNPAAASLPVGASQTFTAVAKDQNGIDMSGVSFTWSTSNPSIMSVSNGVVTALAVGLAMVNVSSDGVNASAQVTAFTPAAWPGNGAFPAPDIFGVSFEDGTSFPVGTQGSDTDFDGNANIAIINDPSGLFGGKVAQLRYTGTDTKDVALAYNTSTADGFTFGESVYTRADILIPQPQAHMTTAMRKLFYFRTTTTSDFCVIKLNGTLLKPEITGNRIFNVGNITYGQKFSLEFQITMNSSPTSADGVFRIWKDGVLVLDKTDVLWLANPNVAFKQFKFGEQLQGGGGVPFDEYRYFDNIAMSRQRIGP
jgi:hypothetical protein